MPELLVRSIATRGAEIWRAGGIVFDRLKKGDRVIIREGMFEGYQAIFDARLAGNERVRVLLRMLNDRCLPLEVGLEFIEKEKHSALCLQLSAKGCALTVRPASEARRHRWTVTAVPCRKGGAWLVSLRVLTPRYQQPSR